jgi:DNA polymerase
MAVELWAGGTLRIDIETYSETDLGKTGVYKYVRDSAFDILLFGYRRNGDKAECVDLTGGLGLPPEVLSALYDPTVLKLAWNASFEFACIGEWLRRQGLPPLDPAQWKCTMVRAQMCGLPAKLSEAGRAAKVPVDGAKATYGRQLVRYFCMPCKPTKANGGRTRNLPRHDPEKWKLFIEYCRQDVVAEAHVDDTILNFPVDEREWARWRDDLELNARGLQIDRQLVDSAISMNAIIQGRNLARLGELTGVSNPQSVSQLKDWLEATDGELIESLDKKAIPGLIADTSSEVVKEALRLRQETSKSSIKKYQAMDRAACEDGRVRGTIQFYGANRTGRAAGRIIQPQNMRSNSMPDLDYARGLVKAGDLETLEMLYGSVSDTLSQLLRTAIVPADGHKFAVVDEQAIEARVVAWLADETWRLEVFRTHGMIYESSASYVFHVPLEEFLEYKRQGKKHPLRAKGKVTELSCAFQGASSALIRMGALENGLKVEELDGIVAAWRRASPRIASFEGGLWDRLGKAAFDAVAKGRKVDVSVGPRNGSTRVTFQLMTHRSRRALYIWLPSGRPLIYWNPQIRVGGKFKRECVSYEGYTDSGLWGVIDTYGGKLTENITQAIARDILYRVIDLVKNELVLHVHDEVVCEVPAARAEGYLEAVEAAMAEPVPWAPGLPLKGEGEIMTYYRKGE